MSKTTPARHVPDALYRQLEARAAVAGVSVSDYLNEVLRKTALAIEGSPCSRLRALRARAAGARLAADLGTLNNSGVHGR